MTGAPLGLYVHVPFCRERCDYCDFSIVTGREGEAAAWADGVVAEARLAAARIGRRPLVSIHFGGGTPSRVDPSLVRRVVDAARSLFPSEAGLEIALEANPEDVTPAALAGWLEAGMTRLSVGIQALDDGGLRAVGRPGRAAEGRRALERARAAGVADLSADVIYGRPGQDLAAWSDELERLAAIDVDHLSLYALETTSRTPLVRAIERGERPAPDDDLQAAMHELAAARLARAGLAHYEISNFARRGHESVHNLLYWTDGDYLGLGPAAASYVDGERRRSPAGLTGWLQSVASGALPGRVEPYDPDRRAGEALVFGLRLVRGVDLGRVARRHGDDAVERRRPALRRARERGLIDDVSPERVALTARGRLLANEVGAELL